MCATAAWHSASGQTPGDEHETGTGPALTAGQRSKRADVCPKENGKINRATVIKRNSPAQGEDAAAVRGSKDEPRKHGE